MRNGYIFFVKEQLTESRDLEPERPTRDLMRHIGTMWNNLSNSEKQRYKLMSEVKLKQWAMEYQAFLETQPDKEEYLRQLKELRGERRKHLKVYRAKKHRRLTQPPRKLSAYNIYVRDQLAGATQDEIQARFTDAAQSWKTLSDEEKAEYELEAKQIHDHEMEEYNNRIQAV
ncbi:Transcription factor A, mitochondrial [Geodia barretti]|uniref:Transcription factor A, mitochondrial n=1 Tax=Geodia barretti TaxID=519541 RepID=A0AA35RHN2_GEOBA|nr:Transcription factor A, mitochondrial [Geodia barretti]